MIASAKQYRLFILLWVSTLLLFLLLAAALNYLVDPYGLFDSGRVKDFNYTKPTAVSHVRLAKPYQLDIISPRSVIAGNSRPEIGLNPGVECWPTELRPVFNLGLPGAGVYMVTRYLQHAIEGNGVELVLWGLDFIDFFRNHAAGSDPRNWPPIREGFEERLKVNADGSKNRGFGWARIKDRFQTLFSLDTMKDSINTISRQRSKYTPTIQRNGFNPAFDYLDIIAWEGQGIIFKQTNVAMAAMFSSPELTLFQGERLWSREFESVRRFLQFSRKHGVRVILFINPYHADYLATLELAGWWSQFELWKRQLTQLSTEFGVELWDFSGINTLSVEQPPPLGDKSTILKWFWEPAHYRQEYGDLMLTRMLRLSCNTGDTSPIGALLTTENIDSYLGRSRADMTRFKDEHDDSIRRIRALQAESGQSMSHQEQKTIEDQ